MHDQATPAASKSMPTLIESVPAPGSDPARIEIRLDAEHRTFPTGFGPEQSVLMLARVIAAINHQDIDGFFEHFTVDPANLSGFPYPPGLNIQGPNSSNIYSTDVDPTDQEVASVLRDRSPYHDRIQLLDVVAQSFQAHEWIAVFGNAARDADDVKPHLAGLVATITTKPATPIMFALRIVMRRALGPDHFRDLPSLTIELPDRLVVPDAS